MAVRWTEQGFQSYDPKRSTAFPFKDILADAFRSGTKKKKKEEPKEEPILDKTVRKSVELPEAEVLKVEEPKPEYDTSTLAGRFAAAGIAPGQPGMKAGTSLALGKLYEAKTPEELEAAKARLEEERARQFEAETGAGALGEELQTQIEQPPSMKPDALITPNEFQASREFQPLGITGLSASARLLMNPEKELKRAGVELAIGSAVGSLSLGLLSQIVAKAAITKSVMGGTVAVLKTAITGLGIFLVGRSVFDWRGDEMDNLRSGLKKVVEDGERLEAAVRNGYSPENSVSVLQAMAEEVNSAEKRIKELGIKNLNYKVSKEYILDQQNVRSSREAILRRVLAIQNIAATGQAAMSPEELLFEINQFGGEE